MNRTIVYWADGTWCDKGEEYEYTDRSDDYSLLQISWDAEDDDVERAVTAANR